MIASLLRKLADKIEPLPAAPAAAPAPVAPPPVVPALDPGAIGLADDKLSGWYNTETQEVLTGFRVTSEDIVVDVGCGSGGPASFCTQFAGKTILIDGDPSVIEGAVQRVASHGGTVEGHVGDAANLPLADASATRIVCTEVLEHVDDPAVVMKELVRIGKPGALYLLSVPSEICEKLQQHVAPPAYFAKPNHIRIVPPDMLEKLALDAGLEIVHRSSHGFFWTLWLTFFWQAGVELGKGSDRLLDAWTLTWSEVLKSSERDNIKRGLDRLAPKVTAIVARKPG